MVKLLKRCLLVSLIVACSNQTAVIADDFNLDNSHASLIFGVSHFGYSYTYGRFNKMGGQFSFDKANLPAAKFEFTIDASSVDTNDAKRDEHLRGPDFFDAKQFPTIKFKSKSITPTEAGMDVVADVTMHGVTREITIPMQYLGEGPGPYGKYRCGFNSQFIAKRSDFGMKGMVPNIGDDISITFSFEGIKK